MTNNGHIFREIMSAMAVFLFLVTQQLHAQRASAEFIAEIEPSSIETGQEVKDGIQNVTFENNILYVVNVWAGIQIIDVSDIYNPKEISKFPNEHRAHNFYVDGNYGYLSDELAGVTIIDISNPRTPFLAGKIETEGDAFWVEAHFPYVYVAEEEKGVRVYDVTDMANPVALGIFDTPGWAWGLTVLGDYVYVADKSGGLQIIDFSDKSNPVRLGQFREPKQAKDIFIEDNYLYLTNGPDGLCILDISNPQFPSLVEKVMTDGFIFDVYKGGKYAYMANEAAGRIEIVNLTDPTKPQLEASYDAGEKCYGVWKEDVYVFVAANKKTLILRHNSPPIIAGIEPQSVDEQQILSIVPEGYDPDGDAVFYTVKNLPEGALFDSLSGTLSWTPTYDQSGVYADLVIRIIERTASQLYAEQTFTVTVNHVNRAPSLPEVADQQINENEILTFEIAEGSDPDVEDTGKLVYSAENLPEGAGLDPQTRQFTWTPTYEQSGTYVIDFVITDPPGLVDRDASTIIVNHVDRKPTLQPIADHTINENELLSFSISGSDPDKEDQNVISYAAYNLPSGASFSNADQTLTWTPNYDQSGTYPDLLFVMTAGGLTDSATSSITVNHISRPPVINTIALQMVDEMKTLQFTISGSDNDSEDIGNLTYTAANLPDGSRFNADSLLFNWTPTYDQSGQYADISFTVTDVSGLTDTKTTSITVNHVNRPPTLQEIPAQNVDENLPLVFLISGSDPDAEDQGVINYTAKNLPQGASLQGTEFSWTPSFNQSGSYEPEFSISDGQLNDKKTVNIKVNHVNRPPAIAEILPETVDENSPLTISVLGSDPDVEDAGQFVLSASQMPEGATFDPVTATLTWTPTYQQSGAYTISFANTDPQGLVVSRDVHVTVNHVNRTPVFNPLTAQTTDENTPLSFTVSAGTDPDAEDAGKLVYNANNIPDGATFDSQTMVFSWTPTYEQSGNYSIEFSCKDDEFTVQQPLSIHVNHINRPPQLAVIEDKVVDENQALNFSVNYSDPDNEDVGQLQLSSANLPDGASFDATNGSFSWTPTYDQAGSYAAVSISLTDPQGTQADQNFNITVNNVNRVPELTSVSALTVAENMPLSQTVSATDPDVEDTGKLVFSSDNLPTGALLDAASGAISWTPNFTQAGSYELNIDVADAGGLSARTTVSLTVTDVNREPALQPVTDQVLDENTLLNITLIGSDEDAEDQLNYTSENLPDGAQLDASNGVLSWTPTYDQSGNYPITAAVSDGKASNSITFVIQINHVNRPPELQVESSFQVNENAPLTFTLAGSDPDAEDTGNLQLNCENVPPGASFDAVTNTVNWTPAFDQAGSYPVTATVTDAGGLSASTIITLNVNNVNRLPVISALADQNVDENAELQFTLSATEEDAEDELSFSVDGLPGGSVNTSTGVFSWTPDFDQAGSYTATIRVSDGEGSDERAVNIIVNNINRPPVFAGTGSTSVTAGEIAEITFTASDPDDDNLTFESLDLPAGAGLDAASGTFIWSTDVSLEGTFTFTVTVTDGTESAETTGTVTVNPAPPPPAPQN
jgi:hypothetical protein